MEHSKTRARRVGLAVAATCVSFAFCTAIACLTLAFSVVASPVDAQSPDPGLPNWGPVDHPPVDYRSAAYPDVGSSEQYAEAVAELSRRGCICGYDDGSFSASAADHPPAVRQSPLSGHGSGRERRGRVPFLRMCSWAVPTPYTRTTTWPCLRPTASSLGTSAGHFCTRSRRCGARKPTPCCSAVLGLSPPICRRTCCLVWLIPGVDPGLPVSRGEAVQVDLRLHRGYRRRIRGPSARTSSPAWSGWPGPRVRGSGEGCRVPGWRERPSGCRQPRTAR